MKTIAFRRCSAAGKAYLVLLHTAESPDPTEWQEYLDALRATLAASVTEVHVFIATDGSGPDARQRKDLATLIARAPRDAVTHVFTTDTFVRVVVNAFRLIAGARAFAYPPREFASACAKCGVSPATVLRSFADAQESLPKVAMLRRIAEERATP